MAINKAKLLNAAQKHLAKNNVDRALREYGKIVQDDPRDIRVRQKIAELLARQGRIPEAMREFQIVASAYERGGFFPKAAAIYKQMVRFEPNEMRWHLSLGTIYQNLALMSDAMDHLSLVAKHYESKGGAKERIDIYQRLLRLSPESLEYADKLTDLYVKEGDPQGAYQVYVDLIRLLEQRRDFEGLLHCYERMVRLRPDDTEMLRHLAVTYLDRGDPRRALAKLQACFAQDPQDTETLNLLADAFVDLQEVEKAVEVLRELADIYESLGYEEYRDQVYDRISELDPEAGAELAGGGEDDGPAIDDPTADLVLEAELPLPDEVTKALGEAEVYGQYGLVDKVRGRIEEALERTPYSFALHKAMVGVCLGAADLDGARAHIDSMFDSALSLDALEVARASLVARVKITPGDATQMARLEAFEEALADQESSASIVDEPVAVDVGVDDLGAAMNLGMQLGGNTAEDDLFASMDQPRPPPIPRPERPPDLSEAIDNTDTEGEMDFDDDEMMRLAAELAGEFDDDLEIDPFAGLDGLDDEPELTPWERGKANFEAGHWAEALEDLKEVSEGDSENKPEALEKQGVCCRRTRDYRGAANAFREILANKLVSGQGQLRVLFELGVTYEAAGNRRSAFKVYSKIAQRDRDFRDGEVLNRVASLALELGIEE